MKAEDIKWCPQHGYPLPCYKCGHPLSDLDQKEIYKTGIQEVVDWIEDKLPKNLANYVGFWQAWQAKKKEWGL